MFAEPLGVGVMFQDAAGWYFNLTLTNVETLLSLSPSLLDQVGHPSSTFKLGPLSHFRRMLLSRSKLCSTPNSGTMVAKLCDLVACPKQLSFRLSRNNMYVNVAVACDHGITFPAATQSIVINGYVCVYTYIQRFICEYIYIYICMSYLCRYLSVKTLLSRF